jgi:hypothetical protein
MTILEIMWSAVVLLAAAYLVRSGASALIDWGHESIDDNTPVPKMAVFDVVFGTLGLLLWAWDLLKVTA